MSEAAFSTVYFQKPGPKNTQLTLELAKQRADTYKIKNILVATTAGDTGAKAAPLFKGYNLVVVTHSTGFKEANTNELTRENRSEILSQKARILTCQHAFGGVNRAIRRKFATFEMDEIIANTLRIFCEGMKVVFEISMMAADAGMVATGEPAVAIAGTGRGADTAVILKPVIAQNFFDLKILEIICLPSPAHPAFS